MVRGMSFPADARLLPGPPGPKAPASFTRSPEGATWSGTKLPVSFEITTGLPGVTEADWRMELALAARTWSTVPCTAFRAGVGTTASPALTAQDDGRNGIFVHTNDWPSSFVPGALAQTIVAVGPDGSLHDADIHLNAKDHTFSLDGRGGTVDLRSVLTHELGHALGLGHATDTRATMFPSGAGQRWRSLEADDRLGVCSLYPGTGAPRCPQAPCPTGAVCLDGQCQRPSEQSSVCSSCVPQANACEGTGDDARCVDLGPGFAACLRACVTQADCGAGFSCQATTESGDFQCVPGDACGHAGPIAPRDAGTDANAESGTGAVPVETAAIGGGGCATTQAPMSASPLLALPLAAVVLFTRHRRRTNARRPGPTKARASASSPC